jgi:hypothetical protein
MAKAREFAEANQFEVLYLVETKLVPVLDTTIKEQLEILIDASLQRSKLDLETTSTKVIFFIRLLDIIAQLISSGLLGSIFLDATLWVKKIFFEFSI